MTRAERIPPARSGDRRDVILEAALDGQGVARLADCSCQKYLQSGQRVPVLRQWEMKDAPLASVLYRPQHRRSLRVRAFVDFVVGIYARLETEHRELAMAAGAHQPDGYRRVYGRASTSLRSKRRA